MNITPTDKSNAYDENGNRINGVLSEDYVLHQQILPQPAQSFIGINGNRVDIPAKRGIDIKTCTFMDAVNWLADTRIKKSETSRMFVLRHLAVRFPAEFSDYKVQIDQRYRLECEMIESKATNDARFFGEVSYQNMVRLDDSLTNPNVRIVKLNDDKYRIEGK